MTVIAPGLPNLLLVSVLLAEHYSVPESIFWLNQAGEN